MYKIKTRNWYGKKVVANVLNIIAKIGHVGIYKSPDFDNKYYLETKSAFKAWTLWALFMILKPLSGGWTYIIRPGKYLDDQYKSIY